METTQNKIYRGDVYYLKQENSIDNKETCLQQKTRPVVVVQNDSGNKNSTTTIVVPMTTTNKKFEQPTHIVIDEKDILLMSKENFRKNSPPIIVGSTILFEQIIAVDKQNLSRYICSIDLNQEKYIRAIGISLGLIPSNY
ncbi:MAG: type II toxin-antitoxin system PemK/MazF family toxin [Defluviitaleaceae bacterium]|nr:type II toxin-antitoxin system PemK/MazF family toxin [Defluviitaleaceae bacterium]